MKYRLGPQLRIYIHTWMYNTLFGRRVEEEGTCKKLFMSFSPHFFLTLRHKMWRFDWPNDNMTWSSKNNYYVVCTTLIKIILFLTAIKFMFTKSSWLWNQSNIDSILADLPVQLRFATFIKVLWDIHQFFCLPCPKGFV